MKTFTYKITEEVGIHARPAGLLVKAARECHTRVTISCHGKSADAENLKEVMNLGVKCWDVVTVTVEGKREEEAAEYMEEFFKKNL